MSTAIKVNPQWGYMTTCNCMPCMHTTEKVSLGVWEIHPQGNKLYIDYVLQLSVGGPVPDFAPLSLNHETLTTLPSAPSEPLPSYLGGPVQESE